MAESTMRYAWRRTVVRDPHLTDATRRVLLELESYADADGTNARPGVQKIALSVRTPTGEHRHLSERTVRSALADGVLRGYIVVTAKAPRGRGNKRADVYALAIPAAADKLTCSCVEIAATQTAGNKSSRTLANVREIPATQTAGINPLIPAIEPINTGNPSDKYRQPGLPTTSSLTPVPLTPGPSSYVSNAHARAKPPQTVEEEPATRPDIDPLAWIDSQLPQGYLIGERAYAEQLLAENIRAGAAKYRILSARQASKRPDDRCAAHRKLDPADVPKCIACRDARLARELWDRKRNKSTAEAQLAINDCPDCHGDIYLDDSNTKCQHPNLKAERPA